MLTHKIIDELSVAMQKTMLGQEAEEHLVGGIIRNCADILAAAKWALENGYRPVSQERVSFEEVTKIE